MPPTRRTPRFSSARKQARLELERKFAHFVEEKRAAEGALESAGVRGVRTGERSALVAEELALREIGGDRTAVENHERMVVTSAVVVQGVGEYVFASARLADQSDGELGRSKPLDHGQHVDHLGGCRGDLSETPPRNHRIHAPPRS